MSSKGSADAPDSTLVAEIDALVEEIKVIQEGHGRTIAKKVKRARKGRAQLAELETLGFVLPEELRALYWNWNGAEGGGRMSFMDASVFFNYMWSAADLQVDACRVAQLEEQSHSKDAISLLSGWRMQQLSLFPKLAADGDAPLAATEPWANRIYFAFDGIVPMLRSVIAAEKAGVISYASNRITGADGAILAEENEIRYDPGALWDAIAPLNPRTADEDDNYWRALATDTLEFDGEPPKTFEMKPEVQEIVFKDLIEQKKKWDDELAKKMPDD